MNMTRNRELTPKQEARRDDFIANLRLAGIDPKTVIKGLQPEVALATSDVSASVAEVIKPDELQVTADQTAELAREVIGHSRWPEPMGHGIDNKIVSDVAFPRYS